MLASLLSNALITAGFAVIASFVILTLVTMNVYLAFLATM